MTTPPKTGDRVRVTAGTTAGTVGTVKFVANGGVVHIKPTQTTKYSMGMPVLYVPSEFVEVLV